MRIDPAIVGMGGRSAALVWRLARDFMRPHVRRILFAFLLMGLAAASTAGRAWLMEPVLDRIFIARDASLLLLLGGAALALALAFGLGCKDLAREWMVRFLESARARRKSH